MPPPLTAGPANKPTLHGRRWLPGALSVCCPVWAGKQCAQFVFLLDGPCADRYHVKEMLGRGKALLATGKEAPMGGGAWQSTRRPGLRGKRLSAEGGAQVLGGWAWGQADRQARPLRAPW